MHELDRDASIELRIDRGPDDTYASGTEALDQPVASYVRARSQCIDIVGGRGFRACVDGVAIDVGLVRRAGGPLERRRDRAVVRRIFVVLGAHAASISYQRGPSASMARWGAVRRSPLVRAMVSMAVVTTACGRVEFDHFVPESVEDFLPGSRLVAERWRTTTGESIIAHLYDPMLGQQCDWYTGPDGIYRCFPVGAVPRLYADALCSRRAVTVASCLSTTTVARVDSQGVARLHQLGPPLTTTYRNRTGMCEPSTPDQGFEIGPELPLDQLVAARIEHAQLSAVLDRRVLLADDGTHEVIGLALRGSREPCEVMPFGSTRGACVPRPWILDSVSRTYGDPACTDEVLEIPSTMPAFYYRTLQTEPCAIPELVVPGSRYVLPTGNVYVVDRTGACRARAAGSTDVVRVRALAESQAPLVDRSVVGGPGGLHRERWFVGDVSVPPGGGAREGQLRRLEQFVDVARGVPCSPQHFTGDQIYCLPAAPIRVLYAPSCGLPLSTTGCGQGLRFLSYRTTADPLACLHNERPAVDLIATDVRQAGTLTLETAEGLCLAVNSSGLLTQEPVMPLVPLDPIPYERLTLQRD